MQHKTEYARSGDLHIAYQVVGDGPFDLVYVPGWVSHVEQAWEEPSLARFLKRPASFSRLIVFDKRGTGLSDRVPHAELPPLEERMDDLRAVMDAASPGAAVALLRMNTAVHIRHVLPAIHVPTLVMNRAGDRSVHVEEGRWMASQIPDAGFVEMPGEDHMPWVGDQDSILDEVQEFLTGDRPGREPDRGTHALKDIPRPWQLFAVGGA